MTDDSDQGKPDPSSYHGGPDFDWDQAENDGAIVFHQADTLAVYLNRFGDLVLRRPGWFAGDDDVWIVVPIERAEALIHRIRRDRTGTWPVSSA
jgi:hypothetical protein